MIERIEPLGPQHDRGAFSCGVKDIDDFLVAFNLALPDPPHRVYVGVNARDQILGYYALRPIMWEVEGRHGKIVGHLAEIDLMMIGVKTDLQGQGLIGPVLMLDVFKKVLEVVALIGGIERLGVGPLNDQCRKFYENADFVPQGKVKRMSIAVREIADALIG